LNVFFVNASIFLKVIEKFLFKKIQRHEKQKTLIEMQLNSIRNMVSKSYGTMKFPQQSLRIFFLRQENKMKHTLSLKK